jgi:hypothetical protein
MKPVCQKMEHISDQTSSSNYQFSRNTEKRGIHNIMPLKANQENPKHKPFYGTNDAIYFTNK